MYLRIKPGTGNWDKTLKWLRKLNQEEYLEVLRRLGEKGVRALSNATPKDTGLTAASWSYELVVGPSSTTLEWRNSNLTSQGDPIAILLQYGHGTGTGGYVQGRDYINPAITPVFDEISEEVRRMVSES